MLTAKEYTEQLSHTVQEFDAFFDNNYDFGRIVYTDWSAKDVLCHVLSWHESFARNVEDIVNGRKPNPLKGSLTEVNEKGVRENRQFTIPELRDKLRNAQLIIDTHILDSRIILIPYKKGSRSYSREEHLDVVFRHISGHLKDLKKSYTAVIL